MRRVTIGKWAALLVASLAAFALAPAPASAAGKAKVEWVRVDVPQGDGAPKLQKQLKRALAAAAKKVSFGNAKSVALTARVVEMTTEQHGDLVRVSCTVMGRIVGGAGARSRISYGGSASMREELQNEVLTQVARGLVGRLAQIVRTEAQK